MGVNKKSDNKIKIVYNRIINQVSTTLEKPTIYFDCVIKDTNLTETYNNKYINCLIFNCNIDNINNTDKFFNCYYEDCEFEINGTEINWVN